MELHNINYRYLCNSFVRCDIEPKFCRNRNKVIITYEFATYKNKEGDHLQEDITELTPNTEDKEESPNKKGKAKQFMEKVGKMVASRVKTVGKVFSKAVHHHLEIKKFHSCQINVSNKGIDEKGNLRQSLNTTRLIRHVDIDKCDSISISVKPNNCNLTKAYLFARFV